jgi:putative DNA primase/helicase
VGVVIESCARRADAVARVVTDELLSKRVDRVTSRLDWRDILVAAGVDERFLSNRHGPCPVCNDGRPRFRFDNKGGSGGWICVCGAGNGMSLLMKATGRSYTEAALWIIDSYDAHAPGQTAPLRTAMTRPSFVAVAALDDAEIMRRKARFERCWRESRPVQNGDPVWTYLNNRLPGLERIPSVLRFHPELEYFVHDGQRNVSYGRHPAMVAAVVDETGKCCNLHRTYLTPHGEKLQVVHDGEEQSCKKLMSTIGATSFAIRLAKHQGRLGIGEGVETALAAYLHEGVPTWSVVNTAGMKKFIVPDDVTELIVYADNDERTRQGKLPGFEAARALEAREDVQARVRARTLKVRLVTPARRRQDMANLLVDAHTLRAA